MLALKRGEKFVHSFNWVKQIKCIEAQLTKVRQDSDMEAPEHKKRSYDSIFKDIHKPHINKRRKKLQKAKSKKVEADRKQRSTSSWNLY